MRTIILKLFFVLIAFACVSLKENAQTTLIGKRYIAQVGETCKDGIGMLYTYRILDFKKDSVVIYYKVIAEVIPERKAMYEHMYDNLKKPYKWKVKKGILIIDNCKEFNKMTIQKSTLIGQNLVFNQEETK